MGVEMKERKGLAYICAPFSADVEQNIEKAKGYVQYLYEIGYIPVTPYIMFSFLNNDVQERRESVIQMGMELLSKCEYMYIFNDMTERMKREFDFAVENGVKCIFIKEDKSYIDWLKAKAKMFRDFANKHRNKEDAENINASAMKLERIAERLERLWYENP